MYIPHLGKKNTFPSCDAEPEKLPYAQSYAASNRDAQIFTVGRVVGVPGRASVGVAIEHCVFSQPRSFSSSFLNTHYNRIRVLLQLSCFLMYTNLVEKCNRRRSYMNKKRGFLTFLLFVLTIAFIAFVIIMQHNFANPDFATAETNENIDSDDNKDTNRDKEKAAKEKEVSDSEEESQDKNTPTTKYVNVDLLNVRSDPNTDSEIVGVVTLKQEVVAENTENDEGWVKITTDDFTGYVNGKYLDEEV
jgi:hypothetical protein